jgi:hypothetical protein
MVVISRSMYYIFVIIMLRKYRHKLQQICYQIEKLATSFFFPKSISDFEKWTFINVQK